MRIVFYLGLFEYITNYELPLELKLAIFSGFPIIVAASAAWIIFLNKEHLRSIGRRRTFHWIYEVSLISFLVELPHLFVHTMSIFVQTEHKELVESWEESAIVYNFIGSVLLELLLHFRERLERIQITGRNEVLVQITVTVFLVFFLFYYYSKVLDNVL